MPSLHTALKLTARQVDELGACWNSVIRRLFGYNKWESSVRFC